MYPCLDYYRCFVEQVVVLKLCALGWRVEISIAMAKHGSGMVYSRVGIYAGAGGRLWGIQSGWWGSCASAV
jgi:hypothetical protein